MRTFGRLQPRPLLWLPPTHLVWKEFLTRGLASAPQSAAATLLGATLSLVWASAVLPCLLPAAIELTRVFSGTGILNDSVATSRLALIRPALLELSGNGARARPAEAKPVGVGLLSFRLIMFGCLGDPSGDIPSA